MSSPEWVLTCGAWGGGIQSPTTRAWSACTDPTFVLLEVSEPAVYPAPTVSDAMDIATAIALLWAIAFLWREIRRAVASY